MENHCIAALEGYLLLQSYLAGLKDCRIAVALEKVHHVVLFICGFFHQGLIGLPRLSMHVPRPDGKEGTF